MLQKVADFLKVHWDGKSPFLLGYSGGPDSKALLYLLLESGFKNALHLAHVDHGWRKESEEEALILAEEAKKIGVPFHTLRINAKGEAEAREMRLSFFRSLFAKIPFQALLLAHHRGDSVETTLKRILEGAHLAFQAGMHPVTELNGMKIWRPLLCFEKNEIVSFLEKRALSYFIDSTNLNPMYLRGKMRTEILPLLTESFGKKITDNLFFHRERSEELKAYLDWKVSHTPLHRGPLGFYGSLIGLERIEARHLLQIWAFQEKLSFSRFEIEKTLDLIFSQKPNVRLSPRVFIDRGRVFFLQKVFPRGGEPFSLKLGTFDFGDWKVQVERATNCIEETDWKMIWKGNFQVVSPEGILKMPSLGEAPRHLWNEKKVPAFLRFQFPVVQTKDGALEEFLSGKKRGLQTPCFRLTFSTSLTPA